MVFGRDFFDLQLSFAETAQRLSGASLEEALLEYTNLYVRFGLGRDFDARHAGWQQYLTGFRGAGDGREWTYRFYLREPEAKTAPPLAATFGCFGYELRAGGVARLHFRNVEPDDGSPLAAARAPRRRAELAALSAHLEREVGEEATVAGASWLYNLPAYRRLFPPGYLSSARPIRGAFRSMPLWGQLLDRRGQLRESPAAAFRAGLARASRLDDLDGCFPFQAVAVTAPAREFVRFYGVQGRE